MIQLIQTLSGYQHKSVQGWFLAKAEWDFPTCSESASFRLHVERRGFRLAVLCARGVDRSNVEQDLLRIWLMKPQKHAAEVSTCSLPADAKPFRTFSEADIRRYLDLSGETNPIDAEKIPVVPGLLLLSELLRQYPSHSGQIRFLSPCYAGESLFVQKTGTGLGGFSAEQQLFEVSQT